MPRSSLADVAEADRRPWISPRTPARARPRRQRWQFARPNTFRPAWVPAVLACRAHSASTRSGAFDEPCTTTVGSAMQACHRAMWRIERNVIEPRLFGALTPASPARLSSGRRPWTTARRVRITARRCTTRLRAAAARRRPTPDRRRVSVRSGCCAGRKGVCQCGQRHSRISGISSP